MNGEQSSHAALDLRLQGRRKYADVQSHTAVANGVKKFLLLYLSLACTIRDLKFLQTWSQEGVLEKQHGL